MTLRRWESWIVYVRGDVRLGDRFLRRHFTERGARRWAESLACDPRVLARTIGSILAPGANGHMLFVEPEVRLARIPRKERASRLASRDAVR